MDGLGAAVCRSLRINMGSPRGAEEMPSALSLTPAALAASLRTLEEAACQDGDVVVLGQETLMDLELLRAALASARHLRLTRYSMYLDFRVAY